jgi:hypothetical protein
MYGLKSHLTPTNFLGSIVFYVIHQQLHISQDQLSMAYRDQNMKSTEQQKQQFI